MRIFRKRLMPYDIQELADDIIIRADEMVLITKWHTPKPKTSFTHGASCCFIKEGYKVSKIFGAGNEFKYYYCDIVQVTKPEEGQILCTDLLLDVVVHKDGTSKVLDLDEIIDAYKTGAISAEMLITALESLDRLLKIIYSGGFCRLTAYVDGLWEER